MLFLYTKDLKKKKDMADEILYFNNFIVNKFCKKIKSNNVCSTH